MDEKAVEAETSREGSSVLHGRSTMKAWLEVGGKTVDVVRFEDVAEARASAKRSARHIHITVSDDSVDQLAHLRSFLKRTDVVMLYEMVSGVHLSDCE